MSTDYDDPLLGPLYELEPFGFGVAARFLSREGVSAELVVIDKTDGVEISQGGVLLQGKKPAACVRLSELAAKGLDRDKVRNGRLIFAGNSWNVEAARPVPAGKGELYLFLQERADG